MRTSAVKRLWVVLGSLLIASAAKVSNYAQKRTFCDIPASKRMLHSLGLNSISSSCLLQSKRDIAHLVNSYLERELLPIEDDVVDDFKSYIKRELFHERDYCCSPRCDGFMIRMGKPNEALVQCPTKDD